MKLVIKKRGFGKVVETIEGVTEFEVSGNKNGDFDIEIVKCDDVKQDGKIVIVDYDGFVRITKEENEQ